MCYVNAYQTQPGEVRWWKNHHPRLLLKRDGKYLVDGYWGEILFDIRTPAKRERLTSVVSQWIGRCADDGFDATASTVAQGHTLSYAWNFGDGTTGTGVTTTNTYTSARSFILVLK